MQASSGRVGFRSLPGLTLLALRCYLRFGLPHATFEGRKAARIRAGQEYRSAMTDWVLHAIGNVGVLCVLGASFLLSIGKIKAISN